MFEFTGTPYEDELFEQGDAPEFSRAVWNSAKPALAGLISALTTEICCFICLLNHQIREKPVCKSSLFDWQGARTAPDRVQGHFAPSGKSAWFAWKDRARCGEKEKKCCLSFYLLFFFLCRNVQCWKCHLRCRGCESCVHALMLFQEFWAGTFCVCFWASSFVGSSWNLAWRSRIWMDCGTAHHCGWFFCLWSYCKWWISRFLCLLRKKKGWSVAFESSSSRCASSRMCSSRPSSWASIAGHVSRIVSLYHSVE